MFGLFTLFLFSGQTQAVEDGLSIEGISTNTPHETIMEAGSTDSALTLLADETHIPSACESTTHDLTPSAALTAMDLTPADRIEQVVAAADTGAYIVANSVHLALSPVVSASAPASTSAASSIGCDKAMSVQEDDS